MKAWRAHRCELATKIEDSIAVTLDAPRFSGSSDFRVTNTGGRGPLAHTGLLGIGVPIQDRGCDAAAPRCGTEFGQRSAKKSDEEEL